MICPMCGNRHAPEYTYDLMGNRFIPLLDEIQVKHGDEYNSNIVVICSRNDCNNLANDRFLKTGNLAGATA